MSRRLGLTILVLASVVAGIGVAGTHLIAQSSLAQIKLTEADAAQVTAGILVDNRSDLTGIPSTSRDLLKRVPPAARGEVTRGLWLWSKAYLNSAAFKKHYASARAEREPKSPEYATTVDQELKTTLDKEAKEMDESMKVSLSMVPADQRAGLEATFKQMQTMMRSPEAQQARRAEIEARRKGDKDSFESALKEWQARFPADPNIAIARRLRDFLDVSATVDFSAAVVRSGNHMVFANPEYEKKPGVWKSYYRYGKESIAVAREVAEEWLKEIGPK